MFQLEHALNIPKSTHYGTIITQRIDPHRRRAMDLLLPPSHRWPLRPTTTVAPLMGTRVHRTKHRVSQLHNHMDTVFHQLLFVVSSKFYSA